jgi:hypothetical protein
LLGGAFDRFDRADEPGELRFGGGQSERRGKQPGWWRSLLSKIEQHQQALRCKPVIHGESAVDPDPRLHLTLYSMSI